MTCVFIAAESREGELRVSATPSTVKRLVKSGFSISVQHDGGLGSFISDKDFEEAGACVVASFEDGVRGADIVTSVNCLSDEQVKQMKEGATMMSFVYPHQREGFLNLACSRKVGIFAMELIPRITRAQKYDALSSQNSIAGYQAVLLAAVHSPKIFPQMTTAAGTLPAARVVVMGAGVAGLQAIATAKKRLGAIVEVSDVRPAVKEQVESLGAQFIDVPTDASMETKGGYAREATAEFLKRQEDITREHLKRADVVICTALVPGKKAPVLISADTVYMMKSGCVIVDMAAEQGGNCALTQAGKIIMEGGVTIVGSINLPSQKPLHSSELYAKNISSLLLDQCTKDKGFAWNMEDEVVKAAMIAYGGVSTLVM